MAAAMHKQLVLLPNCSAQGAGLCCEGDDTVLHTMVILDLQCSLLTSHSCLYRTADHGCSLPSWAVQHR
jgi:hypothetical protein